MLTVCDNGTCRCRNLELKEMKEHHVNLTGQCPPTLLEKGGPISLPGSLRSSSSKMTTVASCSNQAATGGSSGEGDICPIPPGKVPLPQLTVSYFAGGQSSSVWLPSSRQGIESYHWVHPLVGWLLPFPTQSSPILPNRLTAGQHCWNACCLSQLLMLGPGANSELPQHDR